MARGFRFTYAGEDHHVDIVARRPHLELELGARRHVVQELGTGPGGEHLLDIDGRRYRVWRTREGERVHLHIAGRTVSIGYQDAISAAQTEAGGDDVLRADMPGVVVALHCADGAAVSAGDTLLVIESMKMQVNVVAPRDGRVEAVHVGANEAFDKGARLVSLEARA